MLERATSFCGFSKCSFCQAAGGLIQPSNARSGPVRFEPQRNGWS